MSLALLSMLLLGFAATTSVAARDRELSEQRRRAEQALSAWLAELKELPLTGLATLPAKTDAVAGLPNATWELIAYDDEAGPAGDAATTAALAFPIDLNGDGDATDADVPASGAVLVPARLRLTWTNPALQSTLEVKLYVYFSAL